MERRVRVKGLGAFGFVGQSVSSCGRVGPWGPVDAEQDLDSCVCIFVGAP